MHRAEWLDILVDLRDGRSYLGVRKYDQTVNAFLGLPETEAEPEPSVGG